MPNKKDYYEVIQVRHFAEPELIEAAYRRLAKKYHPDVNKNPMVEELMKEINIAYEVLSDPEKRKQYDSQWLKTDAGISETKATASAPSPAYKKKSSTTWIKWALGLGIFGLIITIAILQVQIKLGEEKPPLQATSTLVPEPYTVYIEIKGLQFDPPELRIVKGVTVRWTNMDSALHTINGDGFMSPNLDKRDKWNFTFNKTGTFEYNCTIRPYMQHGKIIVTD